jgi:hypothetical protein
MSNKKIENITYCKTFESFNQGLSELVTISNTIAKLFPEEIHTHEQAVSFLIRIVYENIPSITNEEYPNFYAIDLSADKCSFRTPHHVSFGWKIYANQTTESVKYLYKFKIDLIMNKPSFKDVAEKARQLEWCFCGKSNKM